MGIGDGAVPRVRAPRLDRHVNPPLTLFRALATEHDHEEMDHGGGPRVRLKKAKRKAK